jgi:hypothetical protein
MSLRDKMQKDQERRDERGNFNRFKWKSGANRVRIRPFTRVVTAEDRERPACGWMNLAEYDVGTTLTLPVMPVVTYFAPDNSIYAGHGEKNCPAWDAWKRFGKPQKKPSRTWLANLVDLDNPEHGTMLVQLNTEWRGPRSQGADSVLMALGIEHLYAGFERARTPKAVGSLEDFEGIGEEIWADEKMIDGKLMLMGRTIGVFKKEGKVQGKPANLPDMTQRDGPVQVASAVEPIAQVFGEVIDLIGLENHTPGWVREAQANAAANIEKGATVAFIVNGEKLVGIYDGPSADPSAGVILLDPEAQINDAAKAIVIKHLEDFDNAVVPIADLMV